MLEKYFYIFLRWEIISLVKVYSTLTHITIEYQQNRINLNKKKL